MKQNLFILLCALSPHLHLLDASEVDLTKVLSAKYEACYPITNTVGSITYLVQQRIIGNTTAELVIITNGDSGSAAIILRKANGVWQCESRVISATEYFINNKFDAKLLEKCKVQSKMRPIDEKMVAIIIETLKIQVQQASYKTADDFRFDQWTGGSTTEVIVKGDKKDVFHYYSAGFFMPIRPGSTSCESIALALQIFAEHPDESIHKEPLTKLTNYLYALKEGKDPGPDPMYEEPEKEPENVPTIEELLENQ